MELTAAIMCGAPALDCSVHSDRGNAIRKRAPPRFLRLLRSDKQVSYGSALLALADRRLVAVFDPKLTLAPPLPASDQDTAEWLGSNDCSPMLESDCFSPDERANEGRPFPSGSVGAALQFEQALLFTGGG